MTDFEIAEAVKNLTDKNNAVACGYMKKLQTESLESDAVFCYVGCFGKMLESSNSYIVTRGIALLSANARWDKNGEIDLLIAAILRHITDEKPITSRQCIKYLPEIALRKPALRKRIAAALKSADISVYKDSMRPLICSDIKKALDEIEEG